jgi:serine/threonine protein kinase
MRRFGPFFLETRLAVGGTAEVYVARPAEARGDLPERLVVKRLLPHMLNEPDARTMFEREAKLHAAIRHENVVKVFFSGVEESTGEPFLALELVEGVDGYRLLRRLKQEGKTLPVGISVYIAREILRALASAHTARDLAGAPLHIVHRDVSPSNIYLSNEGRVKLGDFGIAQSTSRHSLRSEAGAAIKGKYAYLAPEQVKGDAADHRADLFSLTAVLAEMLLGQPLFAGGGQLAVLLAIRDCNLTVLEEARARLPKGLFDVLARALSKDPDKRFPTASELAARLAPFDTPPHVATGELASLVRMTQSGSPSRELRVPSQSAMPAVSVLTREDGPNDRKTSEYTTEPSFVVTASGRLYGPWAFAQLIEALATGEVGSNDRVDYMGTGLRPLHEVEELLRFLPPSTSTSRGALADPGAPAFGGELPELSMLELLTEVLRGRETGVLFAERAGGAEGASTRKELYFLSGRLHHVASSNASELLGEYLVRRRKLAREELDLALAILPRYNGRMGDTLISLGLVDPVEIFRAIREQGRDRVADLFTWKSGRVSFYRDRSATHVEFPLDLDLPHLMLAGLEAELPADAPLERYRGHLNRVLRMRPMSNATAPFTAVAWPPVVSRVMMLAERPQPLKEILRLATKSGTTQAADVLRAVEILTTTRLAAFD